MEQNWPRVDFNSNFSAFRMEKWEVRLDNKALKAASHHLSATSANSEPGC